MYPTMASNGDTVREIPIVLHDGTILRKKKEYEKNAYTLMMENGCTYLFF